MELKTKYSTYDCLLIHWRYEVNNRLYLWLWTKDTHEPIVDISSNYMDISNEQLQYWLSDNMERVIIDNDFIDIFWDIRQAKIWLMDNLNYLGWDYVDWLPCIVITKNSNIWEGIDNYNDF